MKIIAFIPDYLDSVAPLAILWVGGFGAKFVPLFPRVIEEQDNLVTQVETVQKWRRSLRITLSAVQTASFMLLLLHAIAVIFAAPSCTSWMFLMYLAGDTCILNMRPGALTVAASWRLYSILVCTALVNSTGGCGKWHCLLWRVAPVVVASGRWRQECGKQGEGRKGGVAGRSGAGWRSGHRDNI
jgi:hypothetical protein